MTDSATPSAYLRLGPTDPPTPLIVAVPHAGRYYPSAIESMRAVSHGTLEQLEDRYADRLVDGAADNGAVVIVGTYARAWIDLNRGEADIGAGDMPASARAQAGLGLVPTRLGGRPLWRDPPSRTDLAERWQAVHQPYHQAVAAALTAAHHRHGVALLVDCHSMPPLAMVGKGAARVVVGDLHGVSATAGVGAAAMAAVTARGIPAARNAPYAGAYTLAVHGRPWQGIHAIQIEMDRSLYLRPDLREIGDGLAATRTLFAEICRVAMAALGASPALAAE